LVKFFAEKRSPKQHAQVNSFENYQKITIFYFGKENYEIMKNFGGFGQILAFFF
jgi:hypothetical protein